MSKSIGRIVGGIVLLVASLVSLAAPADEQRRPKPETNITKLFDKYLSVDLAIAFDKLFCERVLVNQPLDFGQTIGARQGQAAVVVAPLPDRCKTPPGGTVNTTVCSVSGHGHCTCDTLNGCACVNQGCNDAHPAAGFGDDCDLGAVQRCCDESGGGC
jgi:hypothetical protein